MQVKKILVALCLLSTLASLSFPVHSNTAPQSIVFLKQNSTPKYFPDSQTGLCGEMYQALANKLRSQGLSVDIDDELYPIKRILKMLEMGQAHVFCGAGRNAKREAIFTYSKQSIYDVANVVAARMSEAFIPTNIQDLRRQDISIGTLFGTTSSQWLESHGGLRINDNFHSPDAALEAMARGADIRYFYYHDLGLNYLTQSMNLPLKVLPTRFRTTPQWMLYSRMLTPTQIQALDTALAELEAEGELGAIRQAYLLND